MYSDFFGTNIATIKTNYNNCILYKILSKNVWEIIFGTEILTTLDQEEL